MLISGAKISMRIRLIAVLLSWLAFVDVAHSQASSSVINEKSGDATDALRVGDVGTDSGANLGQRNRNNPFVATDADGKSALNANKDYSAERAIASSAPNRVLPMNEFQKFVKESTGNTLPLFGAGFFSNSPSTFSPLQNTPVPSDYALGAGDEVLLRAWGSVDFNIRTTIDRNGFITIPTVGNVALAGVRASDAESVIKQSIDRLYKGVNLGVSFGQLKAITVYVVGQANRPGSYTVSSFSTLVTALFASGGPNQNGSLRHVHVKRNGQIVGELDLYAFIAKGDKSNDIRLLDGDTIVIPPALGYVAINGKVNLPAVYELRTASDSLQSVLDVAGGVPVVADPRRVFLERLDSFKAHPRSVEEFALTAESARQVLKAGDILTIGAVTPDFANAVTLRGNVDRPLRVPFKANMRVSDLIPNRDFLITRATFARQNGAILTDSVTDSGAQRQSLAARIGNSFDEINWSYASVERMDRLSLRTELLSFNLGAALDNPAGVENIVLQSGDIVTIFSQNDIQLPIEKRKVFVRVEGEVNAPGVYQMNQNETLHDLIARAGGTTTNAYLFGTEFYREAVRKSQDENLQKLTRRLEMQLQSDRSRAVANVSISEAADSQLVAIKRQEEARSAEASLAKLKAVKATGRVAFSLKPAETVLTSLPKLKLESGDQLVIPSKQDFVHVYGAVSQESSFVWSQGSTVDSYLKRAGLSRDSDVDNAFVLRVDGTVLAVPSGWFSGIEKAEVMPGDSIVVPEKFDKQSTYTRVTSSLKDWAQILSGFGLGAAAIKTLK
jgi:protein involved in polysaccharide export with SLBB domain